MNERTWERIGASSGIIFFVLLLGSAFIAPAPPRIDAWASSIMSYFDQYHGRIQLTSVLGVLAALAFLWFVGHLRHVLQRAEGGAEAFSAMVFGSGLVVATLGLLSTMPAATLAITATQSEAAGNAAMTHGLYNAFQIGNTLIGMVGALFLATAGWAMVRGELARPWLGWLAMLAALINLGGGVVGFYATSMSALAAVLGIAGAVSFGLWSAIAGGIMLYQPEVERTPAGTVFAH